MPEIRCGVTYAEFVFQSLTLPKQVGISYFHAKCTWQCTHCLYTKFSTLGQQYRPFHHFPNLYSASFIWKSASRTLSVRMDDSDAVNNN